MNTTLPSQILKENYTKVAQGQDTTRDAGQVRIDEIQILLLNVKS